MEEVSADLVNKLRANYQRRGETPTFIEDADNILAEQATPFDRAQALEFYEDLLVESREDNSPRTHKALETLLLGSDLFTQREFLLKISDERYKHLIPVIVRVGRTTSTPEVRQRCIVACRRFGDEAAEPFIIEQLQSTQAGLVREAIRAAGTLSTRASIEFLLDAVKKNGAMRAEANKAIAKIKARHPVRRKQRDRVDAGLTMVEHDRVGGELSLSSQATSGALSSATSPDNLSERTTIAKRVDTTTALAKLDTHDQDLIGNHWMALAPTPRKLPLAMYPAVFFNGLTMVCLAPFVLSASVSAIRILTSDNLHAVTNSLRPHHRPTYTLLLAIVILSFGWFACGARGEKMLRALRLGVPVRAKASDKSEHINPKVPERRLDVNFMSPKTGTPSAATIVVPSWGRYDGEEVEMLIDPAHETNHLVLHHNPLVSLDEEDHVQLRPYTTLKAIFALLYWLTPFALGAATLLVQLR